MGSKIDIYEVVKKLIGGIEPVGATHIDNKKYENLKEHMELVDKLIYDLHNVCGYEKNIEYSMNRAGKKATEFLEDLRKSLM